MAPRARPTRTAWKVLEVEVAFEPSRLAADSLAVAYAQVVPVRQRALRPSQPSRERAWPRWAGWAGGVA